MNEKFTDEENFDSMEKTKYPISVRKSRISGKGAYAMRAIPARKKLGNLGGEIISYKEAQKRVRQQSGKVISLVEFDRGNIALDASVKSNELKYINHSCSPNLYMRRANQRVEFYALRAIRKGEELTCDYGETHHEGKLPCLCGASNCRKYI